MTNRNFSYLTLPFQDTVVPCKPVDDASWVRDLMSSLRHIKSYRGSLRLVPSYVVYVRDDITTYRRKDTYHRMQRRRADYGTTSLCEKILEKTSNISTIDLTEVAPDRE
jgi:hypothetical protein